MKRQNAVLAMLALIAIGASGCAGTYGASYSGTYSSAQADVGAYGDYYDALAPYGTWVQVSGYGWAWCPLDVAAGWRPYTVGRWADTDYGWMWVSEDPWGGIPYHYGRWGYDDDYGWVWVPGDVWAPSWVAWRYGDGWAGWAPLPPEATWSVGVGFQTSSFDSRIDPYSWCFVPTRDFTAARISARVLPPSRNVTILSVTTNVTNYTTINSMPAERGMRAEVIERDMGRPVPKYRIVESTSPRARRGPVFRGRDVEISRLQVAGGSSTDDRMQAAPPERLRSRPPRALVERQDQERQRFDERMRQERAQLDREHARELRNPPPGVSTAEVEQRHQVEVRAQNDRERRERDVMDHRREQLRKWVAQQDSQGQDNGRGHGRGRGRGHGNGNDNNGKDNKGNDNKGNDSKD